MRRRVTVLALALGLATLILSEALADMHGASSDAPSKGTFSERLQAAMDAESRPAKDKARDANRLPKETLSFFGIDSDQRVLELLPGGGWYTRLLAPALEGSGQLYLAFAGRLSDEIKAEPFMKEVVFLEVDAPFEETEHRGIFNVPPFEFGVENLDAVLTFRNLHNMTSTARANANKAVFEALAPGGVYGVIDHTRRHNEPSDAKNWRRLDPVMMIQEIEAAGFVFDASSNLHARPGDSLELEVGDEAVTGRTDRFTLRIRKQKN
jgi:predicted methyltransferase